MRLGLDLSAATQQGAGIARYVTELVRALQASGAPHEITGFYNLHPGAQLPATLASLPVRTIPASNRAWRLRLLAAHALGRRWQAPFEGLDLFHGTDYIAPPLRTRTVLTVHDLSFLLFPQFHTPFNRTYLRLAVPYCARAAAAVLVDSDITGRDLRRWLGLPEERVHTVYLGVGDEFRPVHDADALARLRARYRLPPRYILFLGTLEPRKNLSTLLRAYARLRREGVDIALVVAGGRGWRLEEALPEGEALPEEVYLPGRIEADDLPAVYSAALALALPSWYEGFGFPVLEAMACGTPVVCSNAGSLPEVAGDCALFVSPGDVPGLAQALRRAISDQAARAELSARGLARAARFTWAETARQTLRVYESVVGDAPRP